MIFISNNHDSGQRKLQIERQPYGTTIATQFCRFILSANKKRSATHIQNNIRSQLLLRIDSSKANPKKIMKMVKPVPG
jgi:hypothetical protein